MTPFSPWIGSMITAATSDCKAAFSDARLPNSDEPDVVTEWGKWIALDRVSGDCQSAHRAAVESTLGSDDN